VVSLTLLPKAQSSVTRGRLRQELGPELARLSITNSRLVILVLRSATTRVAAVVVWDWRTGRILLVSERLASVTHPDPTKT